MPEMEDFNYFLQLMMDCRQSHMDRVFIAGSQAEVEGNERSIKKFSVLNKMDVDYMMYSRDAYVFKKYDKVPDEYRGVIYKYVTAGIHPGYVRLLKCNGTEHIYEDIAYYIMGGLNNLDQKNQFYKSYQRSGPALNRERNDGNDEKIKLNIGLFNEPHATKTSSSDHVIARHSPYWPREAFEWITRQRPHDSLSHEVIRRVVCYGCDFVCSSHVEYIEQDKDHEWRFSFSMAELILIKNWSRQQRAVYRTIRVLYKRSHDFVFPTQFRIYHFKTLMLWAVETQTKCFWEDIQLLDSVCEILMDMVRCLSIKSLPHYFIPTNNLFDNFFSEDLSDLIEELNYFLIDKALVFNVLRACQNEEVWNTKRKLFISTPTFLYNNLLATAHTTNDYLGAGDTLCCSKLDDDLILLKSQLKTVHTLIELSSIVKYSECAIYRDITCEKCTTSKIDEAAYRILNCSKRLRRTIDSLYKRVYFYRRKNSAREMILPKNCLKPGDLRCVLFSRCGSFKSVNMLPLEEGTDIVKHTVAENSLDKLTLVLLEKSAVGIRFINCVRHYKFSSKSSPTVPVFWFINKAYAANHYYTLLSDSKITLKICDEIIAAYNISKGNIRFAEQSFPFLLTTQWTEMYDRELQQMLGLSALCRFVIHGSDNGTVHIPVCPVQFALYLKARCSFEPSLDLDDERTDDEFFEHNFNICTERTYFSFGSSCLISALRIEKLSRGMTV